MGDEGSSGSVDDIDGDLPAWLDEHVAESDVSQQEVLDAVTIAYEAAASDGSSPPTERVAALETELEAFRDDVDEKIADVRQRVLQVKEMADDEGGTGGGDELEDRVSTVADTQSTIESDLATIEDRLDDLEAEVDAGFENYESILNDVVESTRRHNARLDTLARVTRANRDTLDRVAGEQSERARMDDLADAANRVGVRAARCESCGKSLDIALLNRPECPECGTTFADVTPATGFFGSATLESGAPPALAAGDDERSDPIEDMDTDPTND